ncbi:hypothetical protein PCAR4_250072 [Paraburkholderia caribensis]|nr:hypothetical protein PCAR4_250072 [Paraburkholderia caribensis]
MAASVTVCASHLVVAGGNSSETVKAVLTMPEILVALLNGNPSLHRFRKRGVRSSLPFMVDTSLQRTSCVLACVEAILDLGVVTSHQNIILRKNTIRI